MADRERLIQTLMDLIRIDSPTGEEDAMDREVTARLQALGLTVHHDSFNNVIAKLSGDGEPVVLSAHLDTVDPGRGIKPILDGDTLRSDGSTILGGDCKAGVSIVLEAITSVVESGAFPAMLFTTREGVLEQIIRVASISCIANRANGLGIGVGCPLRLFHGVHSTLCQVQH